MATSTHLAEERRDAIQSGIRIELVTVVWMAIEAVVGIGAGVVARSILLTSFGLDSVVELVTGSVLLWRLLAEAGGGDLERVESTERRATWVAGIGLALLCGYVVVTSVLGLVLHHEPAGSRVGIGLALVAVAGMPWLAWRKRRIAERIGSAALRGDAACSITCAYMAGTLLVGLVLTTGFGWWWADSLAALALLYWLVPEAREALEGARAGRGGCSCAEASR